MKLFKGISLLGLFFLVSCASHTIPHSTKEENTWFLHKSSMGNTYPIFCKANVTAEGAAPKCFEADIQ